MFTLIKKKVNVLSDLKFCDTFQDTVSMMVNVIT